MLIRSYSYLKTSTLCLFLIFVFPVFGGEQMGDKVVIGDFSSGSLAGWKHKEFEGQTDYRLEEIDGIRALKAESKNAGSGLFNEQRIDLQKTPFINWRWRIENRMDKLNEQEKAGDDFSARIYVVKSGGLIVWNSKAINYVWSSGSAKEKKWPNPFAGDHVMMTAIRSSTDKTQTWYVEKRNLREDFKKLTGEDIEFIDAVAVMTDTDNAHGKATAYYGDIYFTAE
jgi:Protein of unknown function (DUF3047)